MARQRKRRSQPFARLGNSRRGSTTARSEVLDGVELLEGRWAPGSLMDLFGLAVLGRSTGSASGKVEYSRQAIDASTILSIAKQESSGSSQANVRGLTPDLWELLNRPGDNLVDLENTASVRESNLDEWVAARQTASRFLEIHWQSLVDASLWDSTKGSVGEVDIPLSPIKNAVTGSGNVNLPCNSFQAANQLIGTANSQPVWPVSVGAGSMGGHFEPQVDSSASPGLPPSLNASAENGEQAGTAGISDISSIKQLNKQPEFDEHRLPLELRHRTDDILAGQSLFPKALNYAQPLKEPTTGNVRSPNEYDPMRGVLFSYTSYTSVVTDLVKELTEDPKTDDIAYVVVTSQTQQNNATTAFTNAGANMSRVQFLIQPMNSVWMRDYGPHFVTVDNALAIVDSHYYATRSLDNFVPTLVGDNNFVVPTYDMGLYFSGGNFQPGPNRSGFVTALINADNPSSDGFNSGLISELHHRFLGVDTLHVLPQLPFSVDGTGHIDMWMYLVDEDTVVISEFLPGSNSTAISITNNAVGYMENLGFKVYRTPAWNSGGVHYTYANAFRVNNRIFVPVYGTEFKPGGSSTYNSRDTQAIAAWQAAAGPGVEIIPIQCFDIINAAGAIHCIVKQVPRHTGISPTVNIISPAGGEVLTPGSQFNVEWSAMDTNNVSPAEISISVSYGDGNYRHLTSMSDTGSYTWTLENKIPRAESATIKIVARSASGVKQEVISQPFTISPGLVTNYDFSIGAGVNKFAYGSQTSSWSNVNGNLAPVASQLTTTNYAQIASSNASGGNDGDTNRYIAPIPSPISTAESTHLFTFQLAASVDRMAQLDVLWEGYADFASQVELYVWDRVALNWGDGRGLSGVNRYIDSWAGNLDGLLTGSIRSDFSRYVDETGVIRFLVYTDRPGAVGSPGQGVETFHDYMRVTVKELDFRIPVRQA